MISVVIPVRDEEENVEEVCRGIQEVLGGDCEILFVDDGSRDETFQKIKVLHKKDSRVKGIKLGRNFGQTYALRAGFDHARGDVIVSIDSDNQYSPQDIPQLVSKLGEGFDVVCGWRVNRSYPRHRILLSHVTNTLGRLVMGIQLHDFSCTLRAYRREAITGLELRGCMHRYLPGVLAKKGYKITEIPVEHRPRTKGKSKYGMTRIFTGSVDFLLNYFSINPTENPGYSTAETLP